MIKAILIALYLLSSFMSGNAVSRDDIVEYGIGNRHTNLYNAELAPNDTLANPSPTPQADASELVIAVFPNGTGAESYLFKIDDNKSNAFIGERNIKKLAKDEDFFISSLTLSTRGLNENDISDLRSLISDIAAFEETKMDEANMREEMEAGRFFVTVQDGWDIEVMTGDQTLYFGYWGNRTEELDRLASELVQMLNDILLNDMDLHGWA